MSTHGEIAASHARRFLLTNDDGIDAPGLGALESAIRELGRCVVVAPDRHRSGCSHQATTDRGLEWRQRDTDRHSLDGTPVDCTRVALAHLACDVDWVLSGVNEGGNLGADVYHSGTVAAVREAALLGKPGIAFSQYRKSRAPVDWQRAARWARAVASSLLELPCPAGSFWNVNLPDLGPGTHEPASIPEAIDAMALPEVVFCGVDPHSLPVEFNFDQGRFHYVGRYHDRARIRGHDVDVCFSGRISVTQILLKHS